MYNDLLSILLCKNNTKSIVNAFEKSHFMTETCICYFAITDILMFK